MKVEGGRELGVKVEGGRECHPLRSEGLCQSGDLQVEGGRDRGPSGRGSAESGEFTRGWQRVGSEGRGWQRLPSLWEVKVEGGREWE